MLIKKKKKQGEHIWLYGESPDLKPGEVTDLFAPNLKQKRENYKRINVLFQFYVSMQ